MIYQQDWLMRQIEAMIQAILAVALGISANEQTATQIEDSKILLTGCVLYKHLQSPSSS